MDRLPPRSTRTDTIFPYTTRFRSGADFADRMAAAFDGGGVAAFQLRLKGLDEDAVARAAEPLQKLCAERDVAFIVNDSMALAKRLGADGVHLGQIGRAHV